jgi:hypothetical protein
VFTEPLLRNGLHNPGVTPLLGADDIENIASSIVACWTVFTELLPVNALIKSVTLLLLLLLFFFVFVGFYQTTSFFGARGTVVC